MNDKQPLGLLGLPHLRRNSTVGTIIDVGVYKGTPSLYEAFRQTPFLLIDPLKEAEQLLESKPKTYQFVNKALGAAPGTLTLSVIGSKSGLVERTSLTASKRPPNTYEVEVVTLDSVIDELNPPGPLGLKIDTEGFEVEVMRGLNKHVDQVEFAICEASIMKRFVGGYEFHDLVAIMASKGLHFFNFLNNHKLRPRLYDVVFLRAGHPLFS